MPRPAPWLLAPTLFAALVAVVSVARPADPKEGRQVAILVGVGAYKHHKKENQLGAAPVNDVTAMAKLLAANGYRIVVLTDADATREAVLEQYQLALDGKTEPTDKKNALGNRDTLLVMLCGHGIQVEATIPNDPNDPNDPERKDKQLQPFFQTHDSKPTSTDTMVPFNQLVRMAGENAVRTMFLVDACRANTDPNQRVGRVGITHGKAELPTGVSVLYSCQQAEEANQDKPGDAAGHGLFTRSVLRALRGESGLKDDVSWSELVAAVNKDFRTSPDIRAKIPVGRTQTPDAPQGPGSVDVVLVKLGVAPPSGEPKAGEEREFAIADGVKMKFCYIPKGKATLGSPKDEKDRSEDEKEHEYEEKAGFWLGKYAVTQAEWTGVMGTTPFAFHKDGTDADYVKRVAGLDTSRFPAERVSWDDAREFLGKVNQRAGIAAAFGTGAKLVLPHEDRWEYAYRGGKGNKQAFYWGDTLNGDKANCDGNNPYGTTTVGEYLKLPSVVGSYEKAAPHPWGLCDMSGNVWQWCENKYDGGSDRVYRGGSWNFNAGSCRAAYRGWSTPGNRHDSLGFRLAVGPSGQ